MGRPLNKRLFGTPTAAGSEIKVNFHNGTAVKEGYIVKQKASKKFVCEEIGTGGEFTCTLTTGKLPAGRVRLDRGTIVRRQINLFDRFATVKRCNSF